jgi:hypothetical protein
MLTKDTHGRFITILADGKFHESVPQGTDGAVLREYETSDGKKGEKWELVYTKLDNARITNVQFRDGDFGEQVLITFEDEDGHVVTLSQGVASNFGEDILKRLPNVSFSDKVSISPYSFEDNGKQVRGVTFYQGGMKVHNYFWDNEKKVPLHGFPKMEEESPSKDDWRIHFIQVRKFLVKYAKENIVTKFASVGSGMGTITANGGSSAGLEYPEEEINPEDIPF